MEIGPEVTPEGIIADKGYYSEANRHAARDRESAAGRAKGADANENSLRPKRNTVWPRANIAKADVSRHADLVISPLRLGALDNAPGLRRNVMI